MLEYILLMILKYTLLLTVVTMQCYGLLGSIPFLY